MYRNCIFCSAALGSNDSIEHFPVGKTLAFHGAKGRLWAVCPKCARWNLAPFDERWEAIEEAEKGFRDTRLRVQSENVGLAKLRDGTRLIRIGAALPGELALWRYGAQLKGRRRQYLFGAGVLAVGTVLATGGIVAGIGGLMVLGQLAIQHGLARVPTSELGELAPVLRGDPPVIVDVSRLRQATLVPTRGGKGIALRFPGLGAVLREVEGSIEWVAVPRIVTGAEALGILQRGMVRMNRSGAGEGRVRGALDLLAPAGAESYLRDAAARREPVWDPRIGGRERGVRLLAMEMALHEETERKAMEGELAELEARWREAEEIAAIADALPDLPNPDFDVPRDA